jgi:hypothetical protein
MERVMYNTVLGAKPLMADGRTFYYSDYSFKGRKVYSDEQHWSCCSGTLPQVAADYRINTYFRDTRGVWVNLYLPSTLRWKQDGADCSLTQESLYPFESLVRFTVKASPARDFTLRLRIPEWARGASISINGRGVRNEVTSGTFVGIHRQWKTGDRIELDLPMTMRLESIDRHHPETVALCFGPLALFAITDTQRTLSRADLLAAKRIEQRSWRVETAGMPLQMLPFTEIKDEQYSTYLVVT